MRLAAVSLKTAALQFAVPRGFMLAPQQYPEAEQSGSISLGGPMTTAGGLVFIGATRDGSVPVTCETPRKRRKNKRAFAPITRYRDTTHL